jgi:F0F1-type ATP synthase membrane subunit b/b'
MVTADTTLIYILIFILSAISLVGIALAVSYSSLFIKYRKAREELVERQRREAESYQKTFDEARAQSLLILSQAQTSAKEIIGKAQTITNGNNQDLLKLVNENLQMQRSSYDQAFSIISENISKTFSMMPADVKKQVELEVSKLAHTIESEMSTLKTSLQEALKKPFEEAQKEAEVYKKQRAKEFEERLFDVLLSISKQVLRKELTRQEHEKIVLDAFDSKKSEGGL